MAKKHRKNGKGETIKANGNKAAKKLKKQAIQSDTIQAPQAEEVETQSETVSTEPAAKTRRKKKNDKA